MCKAVFEWLLAHTCNNQPIFPIAPEKTKKMCKYISMEVFLDKRYSTINYYKISTLLHCIAPKWYNIDTIKLKKNITLNILKTNTVFKGR